MPGIATIRATGRRMARVAVIAPPTAGRAGSKARIGLIIADAKTKFDERDDRNALTFTMVFGVRDLLKVAFAGLVQRAALIRCFTRCQAKRFDARAVFIASQIMPPLLVEPWPQKSFAHATPDQQQAGASYRR